MSNPGQPRILILGGDLAGNLGDRAIRAVMLDHIRGLAPDADVCVVSREPERDRDEFGVRVVASSAPALLGMPAFLRSLDAVLFGGGQLLQDDSSQVKNMHWAVVLRGIRVLGRRPLIGYGIGIGPLQTATGRFFAARALRALNVCIVRDARSAQWAAELTRNRVPVAVAPDPAIALRPESEAAARAYLAGTERVEPVPGEILIGVAVRRFFPGRRGILPSAWTAGRSPEGPDFELFKERLASAINRFAEGKKVRVLFFPLYQSAWQDDAKHARDVSARLTAPSHVLGLRCTSRMVKTLEGLCDLFVGVPMHSTIMAMGMGVPTLGLAYADKTQDLFAELGMAHWSLPVARLAAADGEPLFHDRLAQLYARREEVRSALRSNWSALEARMSPYREWMTRLLQRTPAPCVR